MSVSKMKKLTVLTHKKDTDALVSRLMRLRAVELRQGDGEELGISPVFSGLSGERSELEGKIQNTEQALLLIRKYGGKKGLRSVSIPFDPDAFGSSGSSRAASDLTREILSLDKERAQLSSERSAMSVRLSALEAWQSYDLPLSYSGTKKTRIALGSLPSGLKKERLDAAMKDTGALVETVESTKSLQLVSVTYLISNETQVMAALSRLSFVKASFEEEGTPREAAGVVRKKLAETDSALASVEERLRNIARDTDLIECYYDLLVTKKRRLEAKAELLGTENCAVILGWVPEQRQDRVEKLLEKFQCAFELSDPEEGEEPPVLLRNNRFAESFEWVLGMYAYPKYGTYDPTFIMSIFYLIIFGLMFADVGYGIIMVVACFGGIALLNPRKGMRNFLAMFGYCGISCIIAGVLFGAYFGNIPQAFMENMMGIEGATANVNLAVILDPIQDPMGFLVISLGVGALHMVAGMAVQFYTLCKKGQWVDAVCDIPTWWLFFAGLGLMFLFPWGKYVALCGALSLIITQGRHEKFFPMKIIKGVGSLYGTINYAADLLSYSRILALGLAASVIGQVVNTMSTMSGPSFIGFIVMILIFTVGHLLNLAINVLGTFVHTSRLQYIEFFGKFYEDGGVPFKPLAPSDKYTTDK